MDYKLFQLEYKLCPSMNEQVTSKNHMDNSIDETFSRSESCRDEYN